MTEPDLLEFLDDEEPSGHAPAAAAPWRILVVDDDADVHEGTAFGLRGMEIEHRPLELLHAYSGAEALSLLRRESDIAVVLLDVVMESDNAGLVTVDRIRGELGLANLRIVLRTGQPGHAPEIETIQRYDINDYRSKGDLTHIKLYTALTAAVRAYDQLVRLDAGRRGLEHVIEASNRFLGEESMRSFAEAAITQIAGLVGVAPEGLLCTGHEAVEAPGDDMVIAATGPFAELVDHAVAEITDPVAARSLARALRERRSLLEPGHLTLFFPGQDGRDHAAFLPTERALRDEEARLIDVFCANIALSAANIELLQRLRDYAFKDRLVELPNRLALTRHIDEAMDAGRGDGCTLALIDIDHFAAFNDMFGHAYGDRLLIALAQRLVRHLAPACLVARVAGDTFGVWGDATIVDVARLQALLQAPFDLDGVPRPVSVGLGLAACEPGSSGQDLLKDALIALQQAKAGGQGRVQVYTAEVGTATRERAMLLQGLRQAFERGHLFVVYQPQMDLASGRVVGAEALVRWRTVEGRSISPVHFIPVAERSGLIVPIGHWVLCTALQDLARMQVQAPGLRMAVNVSPLQFAQPGFLDQLDAAVQASGLPPACLELEITESVAVMGHTRVVDLLHAIKARGIAVAIDDFGTGFSSLSYLDRLPVDRIKIDRAFVSALDSGEAGARIAEMIVPLGRRLGMQVLAEGVETDAQAEALRALGCDEVQGYLYGKPMALDAFMDWLAENGHA